MAHYYTCWICLIIAVLQATDSVPVETDISNHQTADVEHTLCNVSALPTEHMVYRDERYRFHRACRYVCDSSRHEDTEGCVVKLPTEYCQLKCPGYYRCLLNNYYVICLFSQLPQPARTTHTPQHHEATTTNTTSIEASITAVVTHHVAGGSTSAWSHIYIIAITILVLMLLFTFVVYIACSLKAKGKRWCTQKKTAQQNICKCGPLCSDITGKDLWKKQPLIRDASITNRAGLLAWEKPPPLRLPHLEERPLTL